MNNPEDIDYPAAPAFWNDNALYAALQRPSETGGNIQECALYEKLVWIEPDGSKSEFTLRPVLNEQGEIIKIEGLGQPRQPHNCRPHERVSMPPPQQASSPVAPTEKESEPSPSTYGGKWSR